MNLYEFCFSPTGGTEKVMNIISYVWKCNKVFVDLCDKKLDFSKYELSEEDIAIIAVPSYGGRVPVTAVERMKKIKGNGAKAILICVYGNRDYEDTLSELEDCLDGFNVVGGIAAVAEHSIMRNFAKGRPDKEDYKELIEFANNIKEKIEKGIESKPIFKGSHGTYKEYKGVPFKPEAGRKCNHCGVCIEKCPTGAIDADGKTHKEKCISCMRCVKICSQGARNLNKFMLFAAKRKMKKVCGGRKSNEVYL